MNWNVNDLQQLQQRIDALPPEKRALFEQLFKQRLSPVQADRVQADQATGEPQLLGGIRQADCPDDLPSDPSAGSPSRLCKHSPDHPPVLSWAQQRLWVLHQLDPDQSAYNIAMLWRFQGALDHACLSRSLNAIVQRHDSLRTCFVTVGHTAQPVIHPRLTLSVPIVDLQSLPNPAAWVDQLARQEARIPFDLAQAPLLRATLLQLNPTETVLLLTLHHIIADGWSRGILLREFATFYKGFQSGQSQAENPQIQPPLLPDLPIQYSDFAHWQQLQDFTPSLTYWRQQLAHLVPLDLSLADRPCSRNSTPSLESATQSLCLPLTLLEALKSISRQASVTPFMALLAAFKLLLHRYTQQDDIAIGVPIANRTRPETEPLIGFFVNTLVIRTDLSGNPDFLTLLERVRQVAAAAYQHQDLPFSKLVEALQPERHLNHTPFFQIMFQFQNEAYQLQNSLSPDLAIPGLYLTQDWVDSGMTKFDLTWHVVERSAGLLVVVEYRTARFSAAVIERMLGHFRVLLEAVVQDPQQRLSELPLLTATEHQQLNSWNQTIQDTSAELLHHRFETQVKYTPDQIAVIDQNKQLTYAELNARANQLAHHLKSLGVQPGMRVGISLERCCDLMVGLLGILKSGAAYIPIDPDLPTDRISFMLQDAQVKLLITRETKVMGAEAMGAKAQPTNPLLHPPAFSFNFDVFNLELDQSHTQLDAYPIHNLNTQVTLDQIAYLIYTSGSTGQPKGTLLSHRGLSNYLDWCLQAYITPGTIGAPVQSSIGFDATLTSLYAPLLAGQAVIFLPDMIESLAHQLTQQRYSFVKLTPAHLRLLSQWYELTPHSPILPQTFILGGEALSEADLTFWRTYALGSRFINEYGPTEATVGCCVYEVPPVTLPVKLQVVSPVALPVASSVDRITPIPIGRPIPNTQFYILDQYFQPVPIGVPGELYISGLGLAQGYLNRPDLTAERFVPCSCVPLEEAFPAGSKQESRLYRTGDRARYWADGTIEYLGRWDQQVKLRGYRIELEEVAAVLKQHPALQDTVVVAVTDPNQHLRLVSYLVAAAPIPTPAQLRQFLQQTLPDYMVPALFLPLEQLPLTVNGKVDRSALPSPDWTSTTPGDALGTEQSGIGQVELSQGAIAAKLAQIWSEVLGVSVGVNDNFFELGGDSILGLQVVSRANQVGLKLSPRQVFQHQTITELAAVAEHSVPAVQGIVMGSVPLTPIQHWFFEQAPLEPHHFNQAVLLTVAKGLDPQGLAQSIQALGRHHDALRLRFVQEAAGWHQFHAAAEEPLAFSVVDLTQLESAAQTQAMEAAIHQLQGSFDLASTLWRGVFFQLGPSTDRLLLLSHHLLIDGVSWQIILEDVVTGYSQSQQGQAILLPLKTTAFRDWADHLLSYSSSDALLDQLKHWSICSGAPLPTDSPVDLNSDLAILSDAILVTLDAESTQALLGKSAQIHHVQPDEILLAAIAIALQKSMELNTVLIDLEFHGRDIPFQQIDISRTVGWFTAICPVAFNLTSCRSVSDYLTQVKRQVRSIPHPIDYGVLRYLKSVETLPQAEIKFNYLGAIDRVAQSFILGFAPESTGSSISPFVKHHYCLEINSWVSQQQLHLSWVYRPNLHRYATIEQLAQNCLAALRSLVQSPANEAYESADFPAARLSQKQLDQFVTKLQSKSRKLGRQPS